MQLTPYRRLSILFLFALGLANCSFIPPGARPASARTVGIDKEEQLRVEIVQFARQQLGASYRYAGRDPKGFDCSGFTHFVMKEFKISLSTSSSGQSAEGKSIKVADAKAGDLIFFRRVKGGRIFHVALVVENGQDGLKVIHSTSRGVVVDNLKQSKYWWPKISSARDVVSSIF